MKAIVKSLLMMSMIMSFAFVAMAAMSEDEIQSKAQEIAGTLQELQAAKGEQKKQVLAQACVLGHEVAAYDSVSRGKVLAAVRAMGVKQNLVALYNRYCKGR